MKTMALLRLAIPLPALAHDPGATGDPASAGTMTYVIGDQRFTATAPYILRVPANTPHTFINAGDTPLSLTAVFDSAGYTFVPVAANPLQAGDGVPP